MWSNPFLLCLHPLFRKENVDYQVQLWHERGWWDTHGAAKVLQKLWIETLHIKQLFHSCLLLGLHPKLTAIALQISTLQSLNQNSRRETALSGVTFGEKGQEWRNKWFDVGKQWLCWHHRWWQEAQPTSSTGSSRRLDKLGTCHVGISCVSIMPLSIPE
jgi:hypothetical protein